MINSCIKVNFFSSPYSVSGFVDKNRDSQQDVFFDLLGKSKSPFVQQLVEYRDLLSKVAQLGTDAG